MTIPDTGARCAMHASDAAEAARSRGATCGICTADTPQPTPRPAGGEGRAHQWWAIVSPDGRIVALDVSEHAARSHAEQHYGTEADGWRVECATVSTKRESGAAHMRNTTDSRSGCPACAAVRTHIAERTDGDCDGDNPQWDGGFKAACSQILAVIARAAAPRPAPADPCEQCPDRPSCRIANACSVRRGTEADYVGEARPAPAEAAGVP